MLFSEVSVNEAIRQNQLLDEANSSTADLLEELRTLLEDRRLANAEAEQAAVEAEQAQKSSWRPSWRRSRSSRSSRSGSRPRPSVESTSGPAS